MRSCGLIPDRRRFGIPSDEPSVIAKTLRYIGWFFILAFAAGALQAIGKPPLIGTVFEVPVRPI
jgi:hypothetical protein